MSFKSILQILHLGCSIQWASGLVCLCWRVAVLQYCWCDVTVLLLVLVQNVGWQQFYVNPSLVTSYTVGWGLSREGLLSLICNGRQLFWFNDNYQPWLEWKEERNNSAKYFEIFSNVKEIWREHKMPWCYCWWWAV